MFCKIHWRVEERYMAAIFSLRQKRTAKYDGEWWCKFLVNILGSLYSIEMNVTIPFFILNILPFINRSKFKKQFKWIYILDVVKWQFKQLQINRPKCLSYSPQSLTCLGIYSVKTSSSKENVANLVLVSMWTSVKADYRKPAQAIWSYKIQKHFNISPRQYKLPSNLHWNEFHLLWYFWSFYQ